MCVCVREREREKEREGERERERERERARGEEERKYLGWLWTDYWVHTNTTVLLFEHTARNCIPDMSENVVFKSKKSNGSCSAGLKFGLNHLNQE